MQVYHTNTRHHSKRRMSGYLNGFNGVEDNGENFIKGGGGGGGGGGVGGGDISGK